MERPVGGGSPQASPGWHSEDVAQLFKTVWRLALETVDLANFDTRGARFDKVFAVNVNVFWTTPATAELSRIHSLLDPRGRFFLFYETLSAKRARQVVSRVGEALRANGFAEQQLVSPSATLVACVAWRA